MLGEHKNYYASNLKSDVPNKPKKSFQPKQQDYHCKVTFTCRDNEAFEFYANSFTWLDSKESYLICSVIKSAFKADENLLKSVDFHFSKLNKKHDEHKGDIDFLNSNLFKKSISDVSFIDTEVEILISVKI